MNPYPVSSTGGRMAAPFLTLLAGQPLAAVPPTDNPVLAHYAGDPHEDDYVWTAEIPWSNVFNILDYGAVADGNGAGDGVGVTDNSAAFAAAVDAAYAAGGGVVYIPAGVYYFADTIYLKPGVVVRGDTPAVTDAQDAAFAPPTRLEFPKYFFDPAANGGAGNPNSSAFKAISVTDNSMASNIGLVWLDINRAAIQLSGDGTRNRLVFGIRNNNVADPGPDVPQTTYAHPTLGTIPYQHAWQRFSYRFARNINVFAQENVLVANNRINDKHYIVQLQLPGWEAMQAQVDDFLQPGYIIRDSNKVFGADVHAMVALDAAKEPWFRYTDHYAIYVRGGAINNTWGAAPWEGPSLFRPGTTVRDNWVYSTMRVGYHLSGYGLKVLNNVKKDRPGKVWWIHAIGLTSLANQNTLENRGLDISGSQILVDGNDFHVERHRVNNGGYYSVDGEGILVQECCGGTTVDDIVISNNTTTTYIGIYKMPYTRNIRVTGNLLTNNHTDSAYIMVNANKNNSQAPVFDVFVEGNTFASTRAGKGGISVEGGSGGGGVFIRDNVMDGGGIKYPDLITTLSGNTGNGTLTPVTVGAVRDYPVVVIDDPAAGGTVTAGTTVQLTARVTGSYLNPSPANQGELPNIASVELYANSTLLATLTSGTYDPDTVSYTYTVPWTPAAGFHQLAAKATPAGYAGPTGSTEWFSISPVTHLRARPDVFTPWIQGRFPGVTDPAVVGLNADPDQDGFTNGQEFAFGGDPGVPDQPLGPAVSATPQGLQVACRLRDDLGDLHATLTVSDDLTAWEPLPLSAIKVVPDGPDFTIHQFAVPQSGGRQFVRVEIGR